MIILAIDTSCDDTSISILNIKKQKSKIDFEILANLVSSQVKIHQKYGGVYPTLAKREHQKNLPLVLKKALKEAGLNQKAPEIDIIAVTVGPGLDPCLWTGVNFAKDLVKQWKLPIIPINHIESHILVNFMGQEFKGSTTDNPFPAICLIVSGGHTQLVLMKEIGKYKIIGETRDDAAGECFDKTARILSLPYPGGPEIAQQAAQSIINNQLSMINLPRPMLHSKDYDFSFSGLKTAVLYDYRKRTKKVRGSKKYVREMAKEIQQAIIDVLIKKTIKAARAYKAKTIILGGGVTANDELRKQFTCKLQVATCNLNFLVPPKDLCTDNAVMTGITAYFHLKDKKPWRQIKAAANLRIQ